MPVESRVIETEADYRAALAEVDRLMDSETPEDLARLDRLAVLVERYENRHFPMPGAAIRNPAAFMELN